MLREPAEPSISNPPLSLQCGRPWRLLALGLLVAAITIGSSMINHTASAEETGMASIHDWRTEGRKICLSSHFHTGSGSGRTKRHARRAAIADWQGFTAWEYGSTWASFRRAASRSVSYVREGKGWGASVSARACKSRRRRRR